MRICKIQTIRPNFVIYHRRFSTNTNPRWPLAQPMRVVGHNGEINTLAWECQLDQSTGSSKGLASVRAIWSITMPRKILSQCAIHKTFPVSWNPWSIWIEVDSANLDSVFELMCQSRHRAPCALMALVPTAYQESPDLKNNPEIVDFYKFHGGLLEAWDGPALVGI